MIKRKENLDRIKKALSRGPVTAILGPRQCGKTTLARQLHVTGADSYFDLEKPQDQARLSNPYEALSPLRGLVVIDEIQRRPDLFELLRVLADRRPVRAKFLILGSASLDLIKHASESLAGRIGFVDVSGFRLTEVGNHKVMPLWLRGGFPQSFLATSLSKSFDWRMDFIRTFLERDIPQLGFRIPAMTLRRFWTMTAHYHGQIWNGSEIGSSLGVAHTTVRHYLDLLTGAFMIRQLPPWFENVGKRVVKSPKIYIRDSGLLHSLLQISDGAALQGHPKLGASWEGFVIEQIIQQLGERDLYFWAVHSGADLDLLAIRKGKKWGFEIKYSDAPVMTKSMKTATQDLGLKHLWVVYPGKQTYQLDSKTTCISLPGLLQVLKGWS